jgi:hypothetical protein
MTRPTHQLDDMSSTPRKRGTGSSNQVRRWSQRVTETSNALDLESKAFQGSPREMARSLKRSADRSKRRKSSPFRSAMSMLTFYENRAGRNLGPARKNAIQRAKEELRRLYGRTAARK